jgi:hypothetical protein
VVCIQAQPLFSATLYEAQVFRCNRCQREVYRYDAQAREQHLSDVQRLRFHQEHSQPVMDRLHHWMREQIEQKRVEPNSGLGQAINYMLKRWEPLTRFLKIPGAPLDNNICEQALKFAIQHRKNSLSFKTLRGAMVGDFFMSVIHYPDRGFIQSASASSVGPAPADTAEAAHLPKNLMNPSTCSVVCHRDSRKQISFLAGRHRPAGFGAKPA